MNFSAVHAPSVYADYLNDVEIYRGRNKLYTNLMNEQTPKELNDEIGKQILLTNRRIPRSEIAVRVAHMDSYNMKHLCNDWFYDAEPSFTNWGPIETVSIYGSYKYFKVNTLSSVNNWHVSIAY